MKSQGFNLISSDSIRIAITKLYTIEYDRLLKYEKEMSVDNYNMVVLPVLLKRLKMDKWWHATPLDYNALLDDQEFREIVRWRGITAGFMKSHCITSLDEATDLIRMIENELNKRVSN